MAADLAVRSFDEEIRGLDALELPVSRPGRRVWASVWPKLVALAIVVTTWQIVVWLEWRPDYVLPSPAAVMSALAGLVAGGDFGRAVAVTIGRAATGFGIALVIGATLGVLVARFSVLRAGVGSLITGLQTMPSIAWFPLAILLFQLSEAAILFVVVLGAAPSIANGVIAGVDNVPPLLWKAGRSLGARGMTLYRHVVLPAAVPSFISGLEQGWAFAWRSLMAGELLVVVSNRPSIGAQLQFSREFSDAPALVATMLVILALGMVVHAGFKMLSTSVRKRWGLARPANT